MSTRLPDKILALAPGEAMILPDPNRNLDRALITLRTRSPRLEGVNFQANRVQYILEDRILPGLLITRHP